MRCAWPALLIAALTTPIASGQIAPGAIDFRSEVQPILEANCIDCHGADPTRLKGGLDLTSRRGLLVGGNRGPAIDVDTPASSVLLKMISWSDAEHEMPPIGKLPDADIEVLTRWVDSGAPWPGSDDDVELDDIAEMEFSDADLAWWSYQPLVRPAVPRVRDASWPTNEIDAFILARLDDADLEPAPPADDITLVRRVYYDLTGLPPTPTQLQRYLADPSDDRYERLIERLLASPQYGERWGRHWLDLVRFAETDSYERDRAKPVAWKYRDYVIDAFNNDTPYDRFLLEQLAGDELPDATVATTIATGYYRLGIWDDEPTDVLQAQYDDLDGIVDTTSRVMLGMSVACARCHEHKKDPIAQADYYRLLAYFRGLRPYKERGGNSLDPRNFVRSMPSDGSEASWAAAMEDHRRTRTVLVAELAALRRTLRARLNDTERASVARARTNDLVAAWSFEDEIPHTAIDSIGGHHGDITDVTTRTPGCIGYGFTFDGNDDVITIPRVVEDDFTISFWFQTTSIGPGDRDYRWFLGAGLVDGEVPGIVDDFGVSYHSNGRITAGVGNPETFIHSPPGYNDGEWHHVAMTRSRETGRIALYVDGEMVAEKTGSTNALTSPERLTIGRMQPGNNPFDGQMDEVRIHGRALTAREVLNEMIGGGLDEASDALVADRLGDAEHGRYTQAIASLAALQRPQISYEDVLCAMEVGPTPPDTHVLIRGNAHANGREVAPGPPRILDREDPEIPTPPADAVTSGRRTVLANWITAPDNPRTSRVMANRLWQHHFGRGLCRTPNDFGRLGELPTHPLLLDWLATELVARDWSLKSMHRLIMQSSVYRMSSAADPGALASDPRNDLFWRFDMRRLTAEELRDSILAISGNLNLEMGGPGIYPTMPPEVLATSSRPDEAWGRSSPAQASRRSIYIHVKRSMLMPLLTVFDLADTDATCPVRFQTTQPTQALTMINSDFIHEQARIFAARLRVEMGDDLRGQIERAIRLATGRAPEPAEIDEGISLVQSLRTEDGLDADTALAYFCIVVLNLNEFVYLD